MRSRYDSTFSGAFYFVVLVLVVGFLLIYGFSYAGSKTTVNFTVLNTEVKATGSGKSFKEKYLVSTRLEDNSTEVFESTDTFIFGKFNSSDVYFEAKNNIGGKYKATVAGWRVPFLSWYRNILTLERIKE